MFKIISLTDSKTISASPDETILEAMLKAEIKQAHVCDCQGRCSTCRVYVIDGLHHCLPRNENEKKVALRLGFPENIRLACQTRIKGDISIKRPVVDELDIEIILKQFKDISGTKLGREKDLAILFTDIENYTAFAEAFPAYDVVHVLNRYYQAMNGIIVQHKGIISDVAGDGILALFGAIEASENPVLDAVNTVREMHKALIHFNEYLMQMYNRSLSFRAGINFGKVVVGNFDTGMMKKISAIGDIVNMASRIETANKDFGTRLLISQSAYDEIQGLVEAEQVYRTRLRGKSGEYVLYGLKI